MRTHKHHAQCTKHMKTREHIAWPYLVHSSRMDTSAGVLWVLAMVAYNLMSARSRFTKSWAGFAFA